MPSQTRSAFLGGIAASVVIIVISAISSTGTPGMPFSAFTLVMGCAGCLAMMASGLAAVWHYTHEHEVTLSGRQGVVLGLMAGLIAAVCVIAAQGLLAAIGVLPGPAEAFEEMRRGGAFDTDELEAIESIEEIMTGPVAIAAGLVFQSCFGAILGLIGGTIGSAIWKKGDEPANSYWQT